MKRIAMVVALLALTVPSFAQTNAPFEERIEVNAVLLDVIVTDPKGNQILGLTKDDFVVKENGVAQEIESVDYLTNRQLLDSREGNAPFQVERTRENRYFIFFFDKPQEPGALFDQVIQARNAARDWIRTSMKENDLVAIAGHDVRLKIYSDFTSDKKQLERALNDSARYGKGLLQPQAGVSGPSILRDIDKSSMMNRTGTLYQALELLGDGVRPVRARKNLVLFSPGMADIGETIQSGMLMDRSPKVDAMLESLNAANVSVYALQLHKALEPGSDAPVYHQRLNELADSTGGHYFQYTTNFRPALSKIEETNAGYYLVTYRSRKPAGQKGFQKVDVSVKSSELRVVARSGYEYGNI
jgi:VWFA-related protein